MSGEKTHYFRLGVTLCPFSLFLSPSSRLYFTLSVSVYLSICVFYSFLYISPAYLFFSQLFSSVFELEFAISLARWNPNCSYLFPRSGSLTGTKEEEEENKKTFLKFQRWRYVAHSDPFRPQRYILWIEWVIGL